MMDDGMSARPLVHEQAALDEAPNDMSAMAPTDGNDLPFSTARAQVAIWTRLIRPSALLLVLTPALTALLLLWIRGARILPVPALAGIISLTLIQGGASLLDVYLEFARRAHIAEPDGRDQLTARALLARSETHPMNVLRVSMLLMAFGTLAGIPLVVSGGWPVVILGVIGIAIAFLFSATSFALKRFAWADLIIGLALGPGIVVGMMLAQHHAPTGRDLLFASALGLLAMLPAEGAHLRDVDQDTLLGRTTLVTVLGNGVGRAVYLFCALGGIALIALAALPPGAPHGALLAFFALPELAIPISGALLAKPGEARVQVVLQELRAYAIFAALLLFGLLINALLVRGLGSIPPTV
jgi:1,4-dihydroxy-2-naphthoate octaprenyltransferase